VEGVQSGTGELGFHVVCLMRSNAMVTMMKHSKLMMDKASLFEMVREAGLSNICSDMRETSTLLPEALFSQDSLSSRRG
jgi:hypothetical protein